MSEKRGVDNFQKAVELFNKSSTLQPPIYMGSPVFSYNSAVYLAVLSRKLTRLLYITIIYLYQYGRYRKINGLHRISVGQGQH